MVYGAITSKYQVPNLGDVDAIAEGSADFFSTPVRMYPLKVQMAFVRTVFFIVTIQFTVIASLAHVAMYTPHFAALVKASRWVWWVSIIPMVIIGGLVLYRLWTTYGDLSRLGKWFYLWVYTICQGFVVGDILAKFHLRFGLVTAMFASSASLGIILYTLQTRYEFKGWRPLVIALISILISIIFVLPGYWNHHPGLIGIPVVMSFLIVSFPIIELYYLMGELTPTDDLIAPIYFWVDLLFPFRALHNCCELTDRVHLLSIGSVADED